MSLDSPPKFDAHEKGELPKDADVSSVTSANAFGEQPKLVRQLKDRHIAMISIGGVIGTGLFVGTASALHNGGPLGMWLAYTIVGTVCYSVMISLGEMIAYLPIEGGHIMLAERFVEPALSFAMGWNYWYNWTVVMPAELSAAALIVGFWTKSVNDAVWVTICLVVVIVINFLGAAAYGEAEFWFASIKVLTIVGLIILGIVLDLGGGPDHDRLGFRYWKNPGPFAQFLDIQGATGRFAGFWACISSAAFSYIGTEIVAIAAGEAKNPRRNLPRAITRIYFRIIIFYLGGTFIIGLLVPSNEPGLSLGNKDARGSPFVIAIQKAGIKVLPSIINAALLTSAWSAASSDLYTSSRALYGLSLAGNAPSIFGRASKNGLPYIAVGFCAVFGLLGYMAVSSGAGRVFGWFANMTSVAGLVTWMGICITYVRFYNGLKYQGIDRKTLPFSSRLQPYAAWYAGISCFIFCFFSAFQVFIHGQWDTATFITSYLPFIGFFILWIGAKIFKRSKFIPLQHLDYTTGLDAIIAAEVDDPPPKTKVEAVWRWLM